MMGSLGIGNRVSCHWGSLINSISNVGAESTVGPNDNESDNDFLERIHCMPRTKEERPTFERQGSELVNYPGIVAMSSVLPYIN